MKKAVIVCLIMLVLLICGCGQQEVLMYPCPNLNDTSFYDENMTHLPKEEDILTVEKGMFFYEVVEKIGKPHSILESNASMDDGRDAFVWKSEEGTIYAIRFSAKAKVENWQDMSMAEYHQYTIVDRIEVLDLDEYSEFYDSDIIYYVITEEE